MRHIFFALVFLAGNAAIAEDCEWRREPVIKKHDGTFIIQREGLPYQVCSREDDPYCLYDIDEISMHWDSLDFNDERKQIEDEPVISALSLEDVKAAKKSAIDANTNRIRDRDGLAYAGERFAMNEGAQLKWTGLLSAKDLLPFPMTILTIDDKPFSIASQNELLPFLVAAMTYETDPASPLSTGRVLRQAVEMARTVEEVQAIVDDRD